MRIGIDARKLHDFGIGTYIRNLLHELATIDRNTEYVLLTRPQDTAVAALLGENFRAVAADHARALLAGKTWEPLATSTQAQQSQQLAPAFSSRSSTDIAREEGTKRYSQIVEAVARQGVQLDTYWSRIKANCTVRAAPGYDREWFGLWDGRTMLNTPDASCGSAVRELEDMAAQLRTAMMTAQEEARRSSALPGELREIRRRARMDWPGFDR